MPPIKGISKTALWNTWKILRKDLRESSLRDVIDYLDFDVDPEKWIAKLLRQISSGKYEPSSPHVFTLGKSNGFSRTMTLPSIPDLVLYRTIADYIYLRAMRKEHRHVHFKRDRLQKVQAAAHASAVQAVALTSQYRLTSQRSFFNWLKFAQYRKHLLMDVVHPYLVITDITNFFDSVMHAHIEESLRGLLIPSRKQGLLFFLLERLSPRLDYGASTRMSLPVDEFDCSRTLAHVLLYAHDDEMVEVVGEDNCVRWMDDQNFGVNSQAEGLAVLARASSSLARHHLTANSKKSRVLDLKAARRHFHLDLNDALDRIEAAEKLAKTRKQRSALSGEIRKAWVAAQLHEGTGEFDKVLRRLYRIAGSARLRFLRRRATKDLLGNPSLADRICLYMRWSGTTDEFIFWAESVMAHPEQIYPDINIQIVESLLRVEADVVQARRLRQLAKDLLAGAIPIPGLADCKSVAPLLLLRFADRRSLPLLLRCFGEDKQTQSAHVLRAAAIVYSSYGSADLSHVRKAASKLLRNHLADVVKLIDKVRSYGDVPQRYKLRVDLRFDSVGKIKYVDTRALLTIRLLQLSRSAKVKSWVAAWKQKALDQPISAYDRKLIRRLL